MVHKVTKKTAIFNLFCPLKRSFIPRIVQIVVKNMKIFTKTKDISEFIDNERICGKTIGFVPTMGALHEGHLELVRWSVRECGLTVCSIFVNPLQFNDKEDLMHYPRNPDGDIDKLKRERCDVVFMPDTKEIYGKNDGNLSTTLDFGHIETILEGFYRPGHFKGVGMIIIKLFHIVRPDYAYFGQKDLQQYALINQIVNDLSFQITLRCVPIVREESGLAMSSRNQMLNPADLITASELFKVLKSSKNKLLEGSSVASVKKEAIKYLASKPNLKLEYVEMVDTEKFRIINSIKKAEKPAICIAAYIGKVRLIDNLVII